MPQVVRTDSTAVSIRATLLDQAATGGGWPYYRGAAARIEPTCWALLSLTQFAQDPAVSARLDGARSFLHGLQHDGGLLVERGTPGPNYAWNGLALLASVRTDPDFAGRIAAGLLGAKGIQLEDDSGRVRQDNRLQAWSWTEGTFSWIEPTAYCLTALKARGVVDATTQSRVREAEAVIVDRVCQGGGWNYGNSQVLAQDLRPYVPTTALALLAMQDRREHPAVRQSLDWLSRHATAERSSMALALTAVCLHAFERPTETVLEMLDEQVRRTGAMGNAHLLGVSLYALTLGVHRAAAFRYR
jgi:hypothetical protein